MQCVAHVTRAAWSLIRDATLRTVARETVDILRGMSIAAVVSFHFYADHLGVMLPASAFQRFSSAIAAHDPVGLIASAAGTLVGTVAYRVDMFLFVTGLVLAMAPRRPVREFLARRARAVLPQYWMGSVLVATCLVLLAVVRALAGNVPIGPEIHHGTQLAGAPYLFEPTDLLLSLSIVGRFESTRTFQVVAPSMWYVMLALQIYILFPWLRALRARVGSLGFVAIIFGVTWAMRESVFAYDWAPGFDRNAAVLYLIPFRLAPVAIGMIAAEWISRQSSTPRRGWLYLGVLPALAWLTISVWLAGDINQPDTWAGIIGPVLPMVLGIPAIWWLAVAARVTPGIGALLAWVGRTSLAVLVVQDALRLVATTAGADFGRWFWPLLIVFLVSSAALARLWQPVVEHVRDYFWRVPAQPVAAVHVRS